jgi:hypothetical protein
MLAATSKALTSAILESVTGAVRVNSSLKKNKVSTGRHFCRHCTKLCECSQPRQFQQAPPDELSCRAYAAADCARYGHIPCRAALSARGIKRTELYGVEQRRHEPALHFKSPSRVIHTRSNLQTPELGSRTRGGVLGAQPALLQGICTTAVYTHAGRLRSFPCTQEIDDGDADQIRAA